MHRPPRSRRPRASRYAIASIEGVNSHQVARQARAAGKQIFVVCLFVVVEDVGLELILEHLRNVVDRGVQHGDCLAAGTEDVDHRSDQIAGLANQGRAGLDVDTQTP